MGPLRNVTQTVLGALAACLVLGQNGAAIASSVSINPTRIVLTARASSAVLTLQNQSDELLRFQLSAYVWNQNPGGQMDLSPTEDIVFFPPLFSLEPKGERKIRVGAATDWAPTEKTYRLFIDELPPARAPETAIGLKVLTRMGIPIFLPPDRTSGSATLEGLGLAGNVLAFTVRNTGNVHFIPDKIVVRGVDEAGAAVFDQQLDAWYILAGGLRVFQFEVAPPGCARTRSINVEVQVKESLLKERLETPAGACSP
jgi:fimbrial chaperone protein